mgnify:CR=1 FL=1|tara:strand:- start:333 stop:893 length:561 start_codon:yes stop_codon:yes gene_type:complete
MSISISVGQPEQKNAFATQPEKPEKTIGVKLNMRRSLKGDIMIFDHADIDIVLDVEKKTITVFPKEVLNDMTYGAQDRLFKFLVKKGVITPESVQGGNVFGSMEALIMPSSELSSERMALINIAKWVDEERPYFEFVEKHKDLAAERFTDPDEEASTELGEVPHEVSKGSLRPGYNFGPYWQNYTL